MWRGLETGHSNVAVAWAGLQTAPGGATATSQSLGPVPDRARPGRLEDRRRTIASLEANIERARLGLTRVVGETDRAREVLDELETNNRGAEPTKRKAKETAAQMPLFGVKSQLEEDLLNMDVDGMTPLEALNSLYELRKKAGER